MTATDADYVPQELVAGKYRLVRLLGRGGMGSVWEGSHTSLGTRVAVKFIEAEYAGSAEARQRFENEARAAATLRSKHVVQVYDHGVTPSGNPFIVMEFLGGEPLDKRLDRVGRLSPQETSRIVLQMCRALAKAHEAGIVHRDLKPENVFLVWDDDDAMDIVKVVDFGIAKFTDKSMGVSSSTRTGSVLGTPFYMSPEQARGLRSVDYRSDLWSVGVIAFRCMTGRLPFEGEAIGDLLVKICTAPLPVPSQWAPGLPPGFDDWFVRALNREPAGRFNSAAALAEALAVACGMATPPSRQPTPTPSTGSHAAAVSAPYPQQSWGQPTPAGGSGSYPGQGAANQAAMTGAAFTQTPIAGVPRSSKAPIAVALLAGLLVLGGGAVLAATLLKPEPPPTEPATAPSVTVETTPATAAQPSSVAPAPEVAPAAAEPSASVAAASSAKPAQTSKPVSERPRPPTVRPRLPSGSGAVATKTKPETTKPKPEEKSKPAPPKPAGIDVGY